MSSDFFRDKQGNSLFDLTQANQDRTAAMVLAQMQNTESRQGSRGMSRGMELDIDEYTDIAAHKLLVQIVNALTESHKAREILYQHLLPRNKAIAEAVAIEREECAKMADVPTNEAVHHEVREYREGLANAIRARGKG